MKSAGDTVKIKLTQWAMGRPGRPPGTVLELPRHVAQMLVDQNKGEIIGTVEELPAEAPASKRVSAAPRNKSLTARG